MTSFVMQISFLKEQPPQNEVNINSSSWENIAMQLEILLIPKPFQKPHVKFKEQALLSESRQLTSATILGWRCFWLPYCAQKTIIKAIIDPSYKYP